MLLRERYAYILATFEQENPNPETELHYHTDFQLLVAVILSAQCTDKRVNMVTPRLFAEYPTPEAMAHSSPEAIFSMIQSISYPNSKSNYLYKTANLIVAKYHGKIPLEVDRLVELPGVGRKTANVITSVLCQAPNMAVDTHVYRLAHRLSLVSKKDNTPLKVEQKLIRYIPKSLIHKAHHWLILHGRYVCIARKPHCEKCSVYSVCSYPKSVAKALE